MIEMSFSYQISFIAWLFYWIWDIRMKNQLSKLSLFVDEYKNQCSVIIREEMYFSFLTARSNVTIRL